MCSTTRLKVNLTICANFYQTHLARAHGRLHRHGAHQVWVGFQFNPAFLKEKELPCPDWLANGPGFELPEVFEEVEDA